MTDDPAAPAAATTFLIRRQKQVSWFDTRQLLATGSQALAASIVGSMSGRREIMAALEPKTDKLFDYSGEKKELWIDYIADTGDGWNATTSVAWLAGRDGIVVGAKGKATPQPIPEDCFTEGMPKAGRGQILLPAGKLLILGGDEVYPTASPETYQQRFTDPFRCARWHDEKERHVYSIPGNHDWYDGLTSFIRLFCQSEHARRWFGAWQARQRRSYYAIKLPHRWWIWGIDMALEDDLDPPQYDYFRDQADRLEDGDKLILSVPSPTWLRHEAVSARSGTGRHMAADKLDLIMKLTRDKGKNIDVPLVLTGDLHYYARHQVQLADGKRHYIVWGGGGAFGLGTLQVPNLIEVADEDGSACVGRLEQTFPNRRQSKEARWGILGFPFKNPAFTGLLTFFQMVTLWLLSVAASATLGDKAWVQALTREGLSFGELCGLMRDAALGALQVPPLLIWVFVVIVGFGAFASSGRPAGAAAWKAWAAGIAHGLLQIVGTFICVWLAAQLIGFVIGLEGVEKHWVNIVATLGQWATLIVAAGISFLYCGFLFGAYLLATHALLKLHDQEVFSAQAIEGYKGFLRMKITAKGLTIYPIGLRRHVAEWKEAPGVTLSTVDRRFFSKVQEVTVPENCLRVVDPCEPLAPHLIEQPIFIPGAPSP